MVEEKVRWGTGNGEWGTGNGEWGTGNGGGGGEWTAVSSQWPAASGRRGEEGAVEGDGAGAELALELELGFKAKEDGVERRHSALPPFPA